MTDIKKDEFEQAIIFLEDCKSCKREIEAEKDCPYCSWLTKNNIQLTLPEKALDLLKAVVIKKENRICIGPGGCGKSTLVALLRNNLQDKLAMEIIAPTGIAAINAGGNTLHSTFGWKPGSSQRQTGTFCGLTYAKLQQDNFRTLVMSIKMPYYRLLLRKLANLQLLIFDEFPMIDSKHFEMINKILQAVKDSTLPFGGIPFVAFGDPFQILPFNNSPCFQSTLWNSLMETVPVIEYCPEQLPRYTSLIWSDITRLFRLGITSPIVESLLNKNEEKEFEGSRLFYGNKEVNNYNAQAYSQLQDKEYYYKTTMSSILYVYQEEEKTAIEIEDIPKTNLPKDISSSVVSSWIEKITTELVKNFESILGENWQTVCLKNGARIICTSNNRSAGRLLFANGHTGIVLECMDNTVKIKLDQGEEQIVGFKITETVRYLRFENIVFCLKITLCSLPIRLAYSMTIYKSQSLTLDRVVVNGTGFMSFPGMLYVACSRVKDMKDLRLENLSFERLKVSPKALQVFSKHWHSELSRLVSSHEEWFEKYTIKGDKIGISAIKEVIEKSRPSVRLVEARLGQKSLRERLIREQGACLITGMKNPVVLEAAHIKPYCEFLNKSESHEGNGLLLRIDYHRMFDAGYWSLADDGTILASPAVKETGYILPDKINLPNGINLVYLAYHREHIWKSSLVYDK